MRSFKDRIIGAARLDPDVYEEVEADDRALVQSIGVVVLSSLAAGIASVFQFGIWGMFVMTIAALVSWVLWAYSMYLIGAKVLPEPQTEADPGQLLRTIGFASAPGMIRVLGIIPFLNWLVTLIASIWMLAATVIAVRQALDYKSTFRAFVVCLIGWLISWLIIVLFYRLLD